MKKMNCFAAIAVGFLALAGLLLAGCNNQVEVEEYGSSAVPYATVSELEEIDGLSLDYVNYRISRTLAMLEMQEFNEQNYWSVNAVLSETPVIIWQDDTVPKYYEFHVIDNNNDVGYVTCTIDKTKGDPVVYVGIERQIYSENDSRSIIAGSQKVFAANYPNYTIASSARAAAVTDNMEEYEEDDSFYTWINSIADEDFALTDFTKEEVIAKYDSDRIAEAERLTKLWSLIDEAEQNILELSDEEIIATVEYYSRSAINSVSTNNSNYHSDFVFVMPYSTYHGTRHFSYCVPSSIEFVAQCYRTDARLSKSNDEIYTAINKCMGETSPFILSSQWQNALSTATNNQLTVKYSPFHDIASVTDRLKSNKLPVLSTRGSGSSVFSIANSHCRCITGTCNASKKILKKFLWITWTQWEKTGYYYIWDNGTDGKNNYCSEPAGTPNNCRNDKQNFFWEKENAWFHICTHTVVRK